MSLQHAALARATVLVINVPLLAVASTIGRSISVLQLYVLINMLTTCFMCPLLLGLWVSRQCCRWLSSALPPCRTLTPRCQSPSNTGCHPAAQPALPAVLPATLELCFFANMHL